MNKLSHTDIAGNCDFCSDDYPVAIAVTCDGCNCEFCQNCNESEDDSEVLCPNCA